MSRAGALFLDRDGVLNPDVGYPHRPEDAWLFDDVTRALAQVQAAKTPIFVVTNQSGVGRGLFDRATVDRFNAALCGLLAQAGVGLDLSQFLVCPHSPEERCACRKPLPGLLWEAAQYHDLDLRRSVVVGDRESDVAAGQAAGAVTVRLARPPLPAPHTAATHVISSLEALPTIVQAVTRGPL